MLKCLLKILFISFSFLSLDVFSPVRLSLDTGQIRKDVNFISAWLSESDLRIKSDIQKAILGLK
jgi:hypothetical protein